MYLKQREKIGFNAQEKYFFLVGIQIAFFLAFLGGLRTCVLRIWLAFLVDRFVDHT